ncbi:Ig-like domain-containing protein [Clostridium chromiireducens]|uniref:Autolysin n=1 Tax=Clostridium chromiireducens TaxID=225345 RepID=A0A1V4IFA0_9CLOT|nr:Ig-like domain-containing protein [Clostridium chromiireducens]OPJ58530.1 autolysin [Clostridium chromiireducens]
MKNEKLKKIIATALTSTIISTIVPVAASAEWLKNSENNWAWMENGNGITGWKQVEGAWYYFDNDGNMKTGWIQTSDSKWYYMNPEGAMKTGWLQLADGKWYNLAPTGEMKTGWIQESDGKWYNLAPTGEMKTGWIQESGGNWYFANSSGVMQTGVIQVEGKAYVLGESGAMLIGKNVLFEEKGYTTDSSGVIIEGNSSNDHREFTKDGVLITSNANSGTEKTPTAVGNSNTSSQTSSSSNSSSSKQSIKKIESINDMEVEKGTELDEVKLPGNVDITLSNNKTITVAVIWDKGNPIYDKSTAGTYRFYGTITLPTGVINSGNLKASINVNVKESDNQNEEEITLSSVEQLDDIDVEKGTELDEAELPNSVQITLSNNTTTSAAVIWNEGNPTYDENTTGTYIFIGKIKLPEGVTNPNNLKVSIKVNVKESGNEEEITLSSVEQLNDIDVEKGIELDEVDLPNNVDIILSNSITTSAAVTWNEGNPTYDENRAGTYIFIGKIKLPEGVTNPNNLKASVKVNVKENEEQKIVTNVETINDISVANGTELNAAGLPNSVNVTLNDGTITSASISWDLASANYDKNAAGTYTFNGTIILPTGVTNPNGLNANVTIKVEAPVVEDKTVTNVETINDITVANGTELNAAGLPNSVNVTLNDGTITSASVLWDLSSANYDKNTAGTYTFNGTLILPTGVTNPNNLTTTVKVNVENKTISDVQVLDDISVANGTELNAVALPNTVNITLSDNTIVTADVTWDLAGANYDKNTAGTYTLTGTITLPNGVTNPGNIKASVNVKVEEKTLNSVEALNDISVANGTELNAVALPNTVNITLSDTTIVTADVTWDLAGANYDKNTAGTYALTGTITLPNGVTNPGNIKASVNVKVEEKTLNSVEALSDISVANGTELNAVALPNTVNITLSDNTIVTADVTWDLAGANYDKNTAGTYALTGTLILPNGVTNPGNLTASVKIKVENKTLNSVEALSDISVANGTELNAVALPNTVNITLSDTTIVTADVTWDLAGANYDKNTAGTYTLTGTLTLPNGVTNPGNIKASVNVKVEEKTLNSVEALSDISVANGTELNAVALPNTVNITLSDTTIVAADVTWDLAGANYDKNTAGTYALTGTITLPNGVTNPGNLTASVKIKVENKTLNSVEALSDISVANGTELNAVALPNTVNITLSDTTIVAADVTWDLAGANYDKNTVGTYALTGTITLPNGVTNPGNLTASVNVKVEGKTVNSIEQLSDIGVANGTQLNAIAFPSNVNVTLSDGTTISVTVTWDKQSSNYNGYANGTYTFTGTLNLPTDVSNSNNLSVYLKVIVQQAIIQSPFATTVDSLGNVYVGGLNGGSIIKYNSNGIYQSTINSGLSSVWGLMTTSSGDMYISGGGDGRILKYKSNGVISEVPITYDYFSPTQIASDSLGNFYVANEYNAEVIKFDSNWQYVSRLSTNNNGWGTYAVAIDKDNNIYTASDNGIIKMSSDGMNQTTFYSNSLNSGYYYGESYGMAFNSKGNLYVSNNNGYNGYGGEVIVINPSGELIQTITGTQNFSGLITGLAIDSEDNLYVADYSNSNVMKFDRNGNYIRTLK